MSELKKSLQSAEVQRDATQFKKVIQKVISCMTLGMDLSSLFMDMIKVSKGSQRAVGFSYTERYAMNEREV